MRREKAPILSGCNTRPATGRYTYDPRNRLASWTKAGQTRAYGYDALGNLTTKAGQPQVFDDPARPHALKVRGDGATYAYDPDGNVTAIAAAGGTRYFRYDSANRLDCVDTPPRGVAAWRASTTTWTDARSSPTSPASPTTRRTWRRAPGSTGPPTSRLETSDRVAG